MTPIADMLEKMVAEGVPMHVIVLAVRTAELAAACGKSGGIPVDTTAEKRRAYDRERKANKRNSTGLSTGIPPDAKSASSLETSTEEKKEVKKEEAAPRKSGRALPDDWRPSEGHYAEGEAAHRTRDQVDAKAEEMRLWARANGHRAVARKLDWNATFTGWMRRDWGTNGAGNGRRNHADQPSAGGSGSDAIFAGVAAAADRRARERRQGRDSADAAAASKSDPEFFGTDRGSGTH